jgi:hypothetical protein
MATNITAITDTNNASDGAGARQFQGVFKVIPFKFNGDDDSLAAQVAGQCDVAVPGAALGDFVLITAQVDLVNLVCTAWVSAADVVTVQTFNVEGTDASTALAANPEFNGLVLSPQANVYENF